MACIRWALSRPRPTRPPVMRSRSRMAGGPRTRPAWWWRQGRWRADWYRGARVNGATREAGRQPDAAPAVAGRGSAGRRRRRGDRAHPDPISGPGLADRFRRPGHPGHRVRVGPPVAPLRARLLRPLDRMAGSPGVADQARGALRYLSGRAAHAVGARRVEPGRRLDRAGLDLLAVAHFLIRYGSYPSMGRA